MIYGAIQGFSEFLPISANAHRTLVAYLLGWNEPSGTFLGALSFGSFLALIVYFRHDFSAMISCALQCVLFRKKPMTLDERLPFFIAIACLPLALVWFYFEPQILEMDWTPISIAIAFAVSGGLMWFIDSRNRNTKGMFDWNWFESLMMGLANLLMLIPGVGRLGSSLTGAYARNFKHEASAKFSFYCLAPVMGVSAYLHLRGISFHLAVAPSENMTWLSWGVGGAVSFLASMLALDAFMKQTARSGVGQYAVYRVLLAIGVGAAYWIRSRV